MIILVVRKVKFADQICRCIDTSRNTFSVFGEGANVVFSDGLGEGGGMLQKMKFILILTNPPPPPHPPKYFAGFDTGRILIIIIIII